MENSTLANVRLELMVKTWIYIDRFHEIACTVAQTQMKLAELILEDKLPLYIPVCWKVNLSWDRSIKKQNEVFLRRATKIAQAIGYEVQNFDSLNGGIDHVCVLMPIV